MNPILDTYPNILSNNCYLKKDAVIVFVCGGDTNRSSSKRKLFMDYITRNNQPFHFFLAERCINADSNYNVDLLTMEKRLADYSDCILIILESIGAFAELGAFAASDSLCKIILPINDQQFCDRESFINIGPLKKIDNLQGLGPTIHAKMNSFAHCFDLILTRLEKIRTNRKIRLSFDLYSQFITNQKNRLLLVFELIKAFSPIKSKELIDFFIQVYGKRRYDCIHTDIPLLIALDFVRKVDDYYICKDPNLCFIEFNISTYFAMRSRVIIYYNRHMRSRLTLLAGES